MTAPSGLCAGAMDDYESLRYPHRFLTALEATSCIKPAQSAGVLTSSQSPMGTVLQQGAGYRSAIF